VRTWKDILAITGQKPVDAPKPTEALIGALAGCMISGIQREASSANLRVDRVDVVAEGTRSVKDNRPFLRDLRVSITVASPEPESKLRPLLDALDYNGTVTNTLKSGNPVTIEYRIVSPSRDISKIKLQEQMQNGSERRTVQGSAATP
jgi:uncharacterized OsmC-like protein